jgi:hypothetical protein
MALRANPLEIRAHQQKCLTDLPNACGEAGLEPCARKK